MTLMNTDIIVAMRNTLDLELPEEISHEKFRELLSNYINDLLQCDFHKLVNHLYRIDVDEIKLKKLLEENTGTDAATIIADLIIERQEQKLKTRQQYRQDENFDETEMW